MAEDQNSTERLVEALMSDPAREPHHFIDTPDMDRVVAALLRVTMEISVLRDRLDAHESLAAKHGLYTEEDIEAFEPSPEEQARQTERRKTLIARLVRDLT